MTSAKLKTLMKSFVISQFPYCHLVWMFHSRKMNNRINRIHERALRLASKDYTSTFESLLERDNSVAIYTRNLQLLVTDYKLSKVLAPKIMEDLYPSREIIILIFILSNCETFIYLLLRVLLLIV